MTARVYCAVLLCLSGCWSSTEAAPGQNFTANPANKEKCCSNGCGLQCRPPVTAKLGVCPRRKGPGVCAEFCTDDSDCPNNEKCCSNGCGHQCTAPYTANPGVCPNSRIYEAAMCARIRFVSCDDDSDCANNKKCCSNGCGLQCRPPVTAVKPGVCPKTNGELIRCSKKDKELCADDSECPKNQKCCRTACDGSRCTAPVTVKPGVCPIGKYTVICIKKELCAADSECPKKEKCCRTACGGRQCAAPVTAKPGECPIPNYKVVCIKKDEELCAGDSECPKKEKCCSTACGGRQCTGRG